MLGNKNAFLMASNFFEYNEFVQDYRPSNFILEQTFLRVDWIGANSIYRDQFNRYITITKDTGLYEYWSRNYDLFKIKKRKMLHPLKSEGLLRVLDLNFITYPILALLTGFGISGLVFVIEIIYNFKVF